MYKNDLIKSFTVLSISIPTLFRMMSNKLFVAQDLAFRALNLLTYLAKEQSTILALMKIKLKLFLIALYLNQKQDAGLDFNIVRVLIDEAKELIAHIKDVNTFNIVSAEIAYATAYYYYKGFKYKSIKIQNQHKTILDSLLEAESCIQKSQNRDESLNLLLGKIWLLGAKSKKKYNIESFLNTPFDKIIEYLKPTPRLFMLANFLVSHETLK